MSGPLSKWLPFRRNDAQAFCGDDYGMPYTLKKTKQAANYRAGTDDTRCYGCRFYQYGACSLVEGVVEATDLCDLFEQPVNTYPDQLMGYVELGHVAAKGGSWRLFHEVKLAEPPGTVPLLPKPGRYQHPSYGVMEITAERIANFVANINEKVYQDKIPIDAEHETKLSGAVGFFSAAVLNDDGSADAVVEWTDRGKALIEADAYQYVSPEWYEVWTDPTPNGKTYHDVVIGLALTNHPFFKDKALRPLVAREGTLYTPPASKEVGANATTQPLTVVSSQSKGQTMPEQFTEQQFNDLKGKVADLTQKFTDSETARDAAETQAKTFGEQLAEMRATNELRAFTDEVRGRSDHNGVPYVGDVEHHVGMLQALPADKRQAYMERERTIAKAARAKDHGLFAELGSDAHAPQGGRAEDEIERKAAKLAAEKGISHAQAFTDVMNTDKELARRYYAERPRTVAQED